MPKRVQTKWTLSHSEDPSKNFDMEREIVFADYRPKQTAAIETEFYEIADLGKDGYIFPDSSLSFKFKVQHSKPLEIVGGAVEQAINPQ